MKRINDPCRELPRQRRMRLMLESNNAINGPSIVEQLRTKIRRETDLDIEISIFHVRLCLFSLHILAIEPGENTSISRVISYKCIIENQSKMHAP